MDGVGGKYYCKLTIIQRNLKKGFGPWISNQSELYYKYFSIIRQAVRADLGAYTPKRIGHFDLIKKYQHHFGFEHHLDKTKCSIGERYITYYARSR